MEQEQMTPEQRKVVMRVWVIGLTLIALMVGGFKGQQWLQERAAAEVRSQELEVRSQKAAAELLKAELPLFKNTRIYQETNMLKVPIEDLPTTAEVVLPEGTFPDYITYDTEGEPDPAPPTSGSSSLDTTGWNLLKGGSPFASDSNPQGISVTGDITYTIDHVFEGGYWRYYITVNPVNATLSLPEGLTYGKYTLQYAAEMIPITGFTSDAGSIISVDFKITPPCPTGVSLNVTATPQQSSE